MIKGSGSWRARLPELPEKMEPGGLAAVIKVTGRYVVPRFFFHLRRDHRTLADCEGIVVASADAAHRQALATLRDFVQPSTGRVPLEWEGWLMQIADERGRCLFSIPFAEAPELAAAEAAELAAHEQPPPRGERASSRVVYLDIERARREFSSVEGEVRRHIHHTTMLVDRTRSQTESLRAMLQATAEVRQQSLELLTRSRSQSSIGDWCWAHAAAKVP